MKKILVFILLIGALLSTTGMLAQRMINMPTYDDQPYHFGFILAVNQMHFVIDPKENYQFDKYSASSVKDFPMDSSFIYSIEYESQVGFTVGIIGNLRIARYWDLRFIPSLSFGERNMMYRFSTYLDSIHSFKSIKKNIPSTFVDLPLLLKYKSARRDNYRAYLIGGINPRIDLAAQFKREEATQITQIKLKRFDVYGEIGVGFDFYFEWFKLGTEIKMSYGLMDMIKQEDNIYTNGLDKLSSKVFQLTFSFE